MITTEELKVLVQEYEQEKENAIKNFLNAFNILQKLGFDVAYYNQYSGYTRLFSAKEFCFKK